jgi:hypothetical protein
VRPNYRGMVLPECDCGSWTRRTTLDHARVTVMPFWWMGLFTSPGGLIIVAAISGGVAFVVLIVINLFKPRKR